jgi:hypothetical protein
MKVAELVALVTGIRTALPISIDCVYKTNGLLKTDNPYKNAVKTGTLSGMIGCDYEKAVNNQLGREDKEMDFFATEHPWMARAENNLGKNKRKEDGKRYMPIKVQSATKPRYFLDGVDVTDKVQAFIPEKKAKPATQNKLDEAVIWRTPDVESISKIRMLGAEYTIES